MLRPLDRPSRLDIVTGLCLELQEMALAGAPGLALRSFSSSTICSAVSPMPCLVTG